MFAFSCICLFLLEPTKARSPVLPIQGWLLNPNNAVWWEYLSTGVRSQERGWKWSKITMIPNSRLNAGKIICTGELLALSLIFWAKQRVKTPLYSSDAFLVTYFTKQLGAALYQWEILDFPAQQLHLVSDGCGTAARLRVSEAGYPLGLAVKAAKIAKKWTKGRKKELVRMANTEISPLPLVGEGNISLYAGKSTGRCVTTYLVCCCALSRLLAAVREKTVDLFLVPARPLFLFIPGKEEWGEENQREDILTSPHTPGFPMKTESRNS